MPMVIGLHGTHYTGSQGSAPGPIISSFSDKKLYVPPITITRSSVSFSTPRLL